MPRSTKEDRYGKPFTNSADGATWYSRYAGRKIRIGRVTQAEAEAWVNGKNREQFLVEGLGISKSEVVKYKWEEAVFRRAADMKGVDDWENQKRNITFWTPYFIDFDNLNLITPEFVDNVVRAAFGADAGRNPVVQVNGQPHAVIRTGDRERVVKVPLEDRGLRPGHKTSGNRTANTYIQTVQTIFNKASGNRRGSPNGKQKPDWDWGVKAHKFIEYPEPGNRKVVLEPHEVWQVAEQLTEQQRDIFLMAIATMWRRDMVLMLRWDWIDFDRWVVTFPETDAWGKDLLKNGQDLCVPLNETAMAIIARRMKAKNRHPELVFHWRGQKQTQVVQRSWHKRIAASGVNKKVLLHTTRHSSRSWLTNLGVNEACCNWLGGWKLDPRVFGAAANYMHAMVEKLRPFSDLLHKELMAGREQFLKKKSGVVIEQNAKRVLSAETMRAMGLEEAANVPILSQLGNAA